MKKNGREDTHKNTKTCLLLEERIPQINECVHKRKETFKSKGTHSFPFHTITECFLLGSEAVLHLDRKRSDRSVN
jgi:hypothetical protein